MDTNHDGYLNYAEVQRVYPELEYTYFLFISNFDGRISRNEIINLAGDFGLDPLPYVDLNGDRLIQYEEVSEYLTPALFARFDINGNGVIDCEDYAYFMVRPAPGTEENPCGSAEMTGFLVYGGVSYLDMNGDGLIDYDEVEPLVGIEYADLVIDVLDRDKDGYVAPDELHLFVNSLPFDIVRIADLNQDGVIQYEDVADLLPYAIFSELDFNGDGVLDCDDLALLPIDDDWGVLPYPTEEMLSARLLAMLQRIFRLLDVDGNNALSYEEIRRLVPLPQRVFDLLDVNDDGYVTWDEIASWLVYLNETPRDVIVDFAREIIGPSNGNFFIPGEPIVVRLVADKYGMDALEALSVTELLPEGWTVGAVHNKGTAVVTQEVGPGVNKLLISWEDAAPIFPLELSYELLPPPDAAGIVTLLGQVAFITQEGVPRSAGLVPTLLAELLSEVYAHSADTDGDWRISLRELLRVIQLYNSGQYHVDPAGEDGYGIGEGPVDGLNHSADYIGDWRITLPELLRVIQLYNTPAHYYYVADDTEDGFMPAPF